MSYQFKFSDLDNEFYLSKNGVSNICLPYELGYINTINKNINDDIILVKEDMYASNDFKMELEYESNNNLLIGVILEDGKNNINITNKRNEKILFTMNKDTQTKNVGIMIKEGFLEKNLFCHLTDKKRMQIERNYQNDISTVFKSSMASSKTIALAKEIYNSPFTGNLNSLYLQSKVYEIIYNEFTSIINENKEIISSKINFSKADIDSLHKAREIMMTSKEKISITQLARKVAINENKLKHGFQHLFNTSPYAVMLERRMYEAKELLQTSDLNVTEIAYTVGYKYVQSFTLAFSKYFGQSPKEVIKIRKKFI